MSIIQKLIIKEWLRFLFGSFTVLLVLISAANLISGFMRGNVTPIEVFYNYLIELPAWLNKIFPISCMCASVFSLNKLINRNELTAIFAGGFTRRQFITTLVVISSLIALLQFFIAGHLMPYAQKQRDRLIVDSGRKFRNLQSKGLKASTIGTGKTWFRSENYFFHFSTFDPSKNTINQIRLFFINPQKKITEIIDAQRAEYTGEWQWLLWDVTTYRNLSASSFQQINHLEQFSITLQETPQDFKQIEADTTTLNIKKYYRYIQKLKSANINTHEYEAIFYDKFSNAIICIILTILSSISVFNPNRRSTSFGKSITMIFCFTLTYWLVYSYLLEMGKTSQIPPLLAAFTVPGIFSLFLFSYFLRHRKLN